MKIFEAIRNFLKRKAHSEEAPEGYCPNCWGRQEYEGQFFEAMENRNVNINNIDEHKGWVLDYAEKNLSLIELKQEDDILVCQKCKVTYRPT